MRIREDGKHAHRTDTIEQAAEFWDCNKTSALMKSVNFTLRIDGRIKSILSRDDLTPKQKMEIAAEVSIPNTYKIEIEDSFHIIVC